MNCSALTFSGSADLPPLMSANSITASRFRRPSLFVYSRRVQAEQAGQVRIFRTTLCTSGFFNSSKLTEENPGLGIVNKRTSTWLATGKHHSFYTPLANPAMFRCLVLDRRESLGKPLKSADDDFVAGLRFFSTTQQQDGIAKLH